MTMQTVAYRNIMSMHKYVLLISLVCQRVKFLLIKIQKSLVYRCTHITFLHTASFLASR